MTDAGKHVLSVLIVARYFLVTVPPGILSHGKMSNQLGRMLQPSFIQKNDTENDPQAPKTGRIPRFKEVGF